MFSNLESPTQSDSAIIATVEDLISIAMGPAEKNTVNYKVLQAILHILARQMRMLKQQVEIRISEPPPKSAKTRTSSAKSARGGFKVVKEEDSTSYSSSEPTKASWKRGEKAETAKSKDRMKPKRDIYRDREDDDEKDMLSSEDKEREENKLKDEKEKAKQAKVDGQDKEQIGKEKDVAKVEFKDIDERSLNNKKKENDRKRTESLLSSKKARLVSKYSDRAESDKEQETKIDDNVKLDAKDRDRTEKERKQVEKEKLRDRAESDNEQERKRDDKVKLDAKDIEAIKKEKKTEKKKGEKKYIDAKDRDKAEGDKEKQRNIDEKENLAAKDIDRAESDKEQERKEDKKEKHDPKDRDRAEKDKKKEKNTEMKKDEKKYIDAKDRDRAEGGKEKEIKIDEKEKLAAKDIDRAESDKEQEIKEDKKEKHDPKDRDRAEKDKKKEKNIDGEKNLDAKYRDSAKGDKEKEDKKENLNAKDIDRAEGDRKKERKQEKKEKIYAKYGDRAEEDKEMARKEDEKEKLDSTDRERVKRDKEKERKKDKTGKLDSRDREQKETDKNISDIEKVSSAEKAEKLDAKDKERAKVKKDRKKDDKDFLDKAKHGSKDKERAGDEIEMSSTLSEKAKLDKIKAGKENDKKRSDKGKSSSSSSDKAKLSREGDLILLKDTKGGVKHLSSSSFISAEDLSNAKYGKEKQKEGISVKERDNVLVVGRAPRVDSQSSAASIAVVTLSQFKILEKKVEDLEEKSSPIPYPSMPDNQTLRKEFAKGSLSLTDAMQSMQVSIRMQAAEEAINRMAGMITQLAAGGRLPRDQSAPGRDKGDKYVKERSGRTTRDVGVDTSSTAITFDLPLPQPPPTRTGYSGASTGVTTPTPTFVGSTIEGQDGVTRAELQDAMRRLRDNLIKICNGMATKAHKAAEAASSTISDVVKKMEIVVNVNSRINELFRLVNDYAEQLTGFGAGVSAQMICFEEQMVLIRDDVKDGKAQMEAATRRSDSEAVQELYEVYENLVSKLEITINMHDHLLVSQDNIGEKLNNLLATVEELQEQKSDHDELIDGLQDKADMSRLAKLLPAADFDVYRAELMQKLEVTQVKFDRQEALWMSALKELENIMHGKSDYMHLINAKIETEDRLTQLQRDVKLLSIRLGEPKAALLTRQLAIGANCGACNEAALQDLTDPCAGKPPSLPPMRSQPVAPVDICEPPYKPRRIPDDKGPSSIRQHVCRRWVGGSHTLLNENVTSTKPTPTQHIGPYTKKYSGYGDDGKLYMLEEELDLCLECNKLVTDVDEVTVDGAGDTGVQKTTLQL